MRQPTRPASLQPLPLTRRAGHQAILPTARRRVIILVKAGAPVDQTIDQLSAYMEPGDIIVDGGNEWCAPQSQRRCTWAAPSQTCPHAGPPVCLVRCRYENTERRAAKLQPKGILYMGMGVSGGEEGARRGASRVLRAGVRSLCCAAAVRALPCGTPRPRCRLRRNLLRPVAQAPR